VLDEAHNLESIATDYLSYEFSLPALTRILNRLIRKGRGKRGGRTGGVLASIERQAQKGLLAGDAAGTRLRRLMEDATGAVVRIVAAADDVFDLAAHLLRPAKGGDVLRYRVQEVANGGLPAAPVRSYSLHGLFTPYAADEWDEDNLFAAETRLENELAALVNLLHELRDVLESSAPEGEFNFLGDLAAQLNGVADSLVAFANEANFVLAGDKTTHAYWIERVREERRHAYLRLVAAPLSVADSLRELLYGPKDSVVLSSATLRVGNDFKYTARRLGFGADARHAAAEAEADRYRAFVAASPFDYLRQALVLAPDCLPEPAADPNGYATALAALLGDLFAATDSRALVLFTSYEMMNAVAAAARAPLAAAGVELLVQEGAGQRRPLRRAVVLGGRGRRGRRAQLRRDRAPAVRAGRLADHRGTRGEDRPRGRQLLPRLCASRGRHQVPAGVRSAHPLDARPGRGRRDRPAPRHQELRRDVPPLDPRVRPYGQLPRRADRPHDGILRPLTRVRRGAKKR